MSPDKSVVVINEETIIGNQFEFVRSVSNKGYTGKKGLCGSRNGTRSRIQAPVVCKPFVNFSVGPFMALGSQLKNKTYGLQPISQNKIVSDTSRYILAESGYSNPVLGLSVLGNVEWKTGKSFGLGGSAGFGIIIENNPRLNYLAAISAFFGSKQQFVTSLGITAMQVNTLNNSLLAANQQGIQYLSSDKPVISYYKVVRSGLFISLTFTPFEATVQLK